MNLYRIQILSYLKGVSLLWNLINFQWMYQVCSFYIDSMQHYKATTKKKEAYHIIIGSFSVTTQDKSYCYSYGPSRNSKSQAFVFITTTYF